MSLEAAHILRAEDDVLLLSLKYAMMQASVVSAMWRTDARLWQAAVKRGSTIKPCTLWPIQVRILTARNSAVGIAVLFIIIRTSTKKLLRAMWRVWLSMSKGKDTHKHSDLWDRDRKVVTRTTALISAAPRVFTVLVSDCKGLAGRVW